MDYMERIAGLNNDDKIPVLYLTPEERELLVNVIDVLEEKVNCIVKYNFGDMDQIDIVFKRDGNFYIYSVNTFETGTMFAQLQYDKKYTIKELGLKRR